MVLVPEIKLIRTDTTLDLSQRPRRYDSDTARPRLNWSTCTKRVAGAPCCLLQVRGSRPGAAVVPPSSVGRAQDS